MANFLRASVSWYVGQRWDTNRVTANWWTVPRLKAYIERAISPQNGRGVIGALEALPEWSSAGRAVSVGAGSGGKERAILKAGLVDKFDLFELSEARAEQARQGASDDNLADRMQVHVADAFAVDSKNTYDLVYWDHALHHMMDVDRAMEWSIDALKPGGLLVINDYVGPTRLQWTKKEIDFARQFLTDNLDYVQADPSDLRYKNPLNRLAMMMRDPSEAPQSDLILQSFKDRCGEEMRLIGGTMVHLLAPYVARFDDQHDPIFDSLIDWDQQALKSGLSHFAFAAWRKPD
ncbi:MAG: class I SAM-dependent methyltransferase [Roseibium sp.]|uniref:class I SAM-dependent methyltransferase n=1 Tax=Roseibium sp. TaxID=1936156 RepID=UPI003D9C034E